MSKPKTLVNKATTDDRTPPSGYILEELAKKSFSVTECDEIETLVLKKLTKNKPYVKKKALRIVKFICEKGAPQWKRSWQRHTDKLKECQQYRGPPDQVYGDSPYKEVREAAKEAMSAIFAATQMDNSQLRTRIKGLDGGQTAYSNSGVVKQKATFGSGTQGVYSNPSRPRGPAPSSNRNNNNRNIGVDGVGNTKYRPQARQQPFKPLETGGYSAAKYGHKNPHSTGKLDNRTARGDSKRKRKTAGGVWGDEDANDNDDDDNDEYNGNDDETFADNDSSRNNRTFSSSNNGASSNNRNNNNNNSNRRKTASRSDGRFEKKWVDDICKGAGIGIKISRDDLTKYVQQFENLSQDHVLEYLDEKLMGADSWKEQGKALTLIEALLDGSSSSNVEEYFQASFEGLQLLAEEGKPMLKKKAKLIMEIVGVDEDDQQDNNVNNMNDDDDNDDNDEKYQATQAAQQGTKQQSQKGKGNQQANILDFDLMPSATQGDEDDGGILDGLNLENTSGGNDNNDGLFSGIEVADASAQSAQQAPIENGGFSSLLPQESGNRNENGNVSSLLPSGQSEQQNEAKTHEDYFKGLDFVQESTDISGLISGQQQQQGQQGQQGQGSNSGTGQSTFSFLNQNGGQQGQGQGQGQTQMSQDGGSQSSGFSFLSNNKGAGSSMGGLVQQTNQNVTAMNQMMNNMNQITSMMQQAQLSQSGQGNQQSGMAPMGMNNMNNMNNLNRMGGFNGMSGMGQMGGMNQMSNMNQMNQMNQLGGMGGMNMNGMGMSNLNNMNNMNNMNMNNMNNMAMGGMNGMNGMNRMNQNPNGMSQMMMNNMSMFSGTTSQLNQHHTNPLSQMRQNDPFAAVINGGSNAMAGSTTQNQPKKKENDPFSSFNLTNLTS